MAITFRSVEHSVKSGVQIIEVLLNNEVVGAIYPDSERNGISIVSAHFSEKDIPGDFDGVVTEDSGGNKFPPIPAVKIVFKPRKYIICDGKIQHLE